MAIARTRMLLGLGLAVVLVLGVLALARPGAETRQQTTQQTTQQQTTQPPRPLAPEAGATGIGDPYFPGDGNGGYDVDAYDIAVRHDPATDRLDGRTTIVARTTADLSEFSLDLMLAATAVTVDGRPAAFRQEAGELVVTPAEPLRRGARTTVRVDYGGVPSQVEVDGESPWVRTADGAVAVGQPDIASWWFPSNDHPRDKARVSVTATVPAGVEAIAGGALLGGPEAAGPGLVRWRWRAAEPMAPYLAFVAIGQYDLVRRDTPHGPYVAAYGSGVKPEWLPAARASLERTPEIVGFLEGLFGEYPFAQLGGVVPDAPGLSFALENQSRPVYSPVFFSRGENVDVVVHELAHQWFGDSVSVQRWQDIWLNEGFATYAEWLYSERTGGPSAQQIADEEYDRRDPESAFWQVPPGDPGAAQLLDNAVYKRGALALHAIRVEIGDGPFMALLRTWVAQRRGGNGTVQDFLALAEQQSGRQLDELADAWLFRPGRPERIG